MNPIEIWLFRLLVLVFVGLFAWQMAARYRLFARAKPNRDTHDLGRRIRTVVAMAEAS